MKATGIVRRIDDLGEGGDYQKKFEGHFVFGKEIHWKFLPREKAV